MQYADLCTSELPEVRATDGVLRNCSRFSRDLSASREEGAELSERRDQNGISTRFLRRAPDQVFSDDRCATRFRRGRVTDRRPAPAGPSAAKAGPAPGRTGATGGATGTPAARLTSSIAPCRGAGEQPNNRSCELLHTVQHDDDQVQERAEHAQDGGRESAEQDPERHDGTQRTTCGENARPDEKHGEDRDEQRRDVWARRAEDRVLPRQEEQRGREQRQGRPGDSGADDRRAGPAVCEPVRTAQRGDPGDVQQTHP
jgi:hypothetical protein